MVFFGLGFLGVSAFRITRGLLEQYANAFTACSISGHFVGGGREQDR